MDTAVVPQVTSCNGQLPPNPSTDIPLRTIGPREITTGLTKAPFHIEDLIAYFAPPGNTVTRPVARGVTLAKDPSRAVGLMANGTSAFGTLGTALPVPPDVPPLVQIIPT